VFNARTNEVKFVVREDKRSVEISSAEQGIGENAYILPARVSGVAQEAIFNGRYIYDALQVLRGNEVFWGISKDNAPALFRDALSSSYIYIVKPILKT